jgi:hypothetical protein
MYVLSIVSLVIGFIMSDAAARYPSDPAKSKAELTGSWKQVSMRLGAETKEGGGNGKTKLLHVTPTHFTRIAFDPNTKQLFGVVGGTYTIAGETYRETIAYADESTRKALEKDNSAGLTFEWKLENEQLKLTLVGGGQTYVETWERLK